MDSGFGDGTAGLFLWPGITLFLGAIGGTSEHAHHAMQLCVAWDLPFRLQRQGLQEGAWQTLESALIPAGLSHRFDGQGHVHAILLLDGEGRLGRAVAARGLQASRAERPPWPRDLGMGASTVAWLLGDLPEQPGRPSDARIVRTLEHIAHPGARRFRGRELAKRVALSETRFLHLFKEQVGLPLRRYILWRRILDAVAEVSRGSDLTGAAHAGGFSDSAHFSRVFRRNFGLAPSKVLKNSQFVQVHSQLGP